MQSGSPSEEEHSRYRSITGRLLNLAIKAKREFCVAASMLGSNVALPRQTHIVAANRAFRYMNAIVHSYAAMNAWNNNQLTAQVDASWGADTERKRKSRADYMIRYGEAIIYAISCLQKSVAFSFTEAE